MNWHPVLISLIVLGLCRQNPAFAEEQNIFALRSAYLYYFSRFVTWPASTEFPNRQLQLCIRTDSEKNKFQLSTIENKTTGKNKLKIRYVDAKTAKAKDVLSQCHMLYADEKYDSWIKKNQKILTAATLVVTEGTVKNKGTIHLHLAGNKLRFEVDRKKAEKQDLKISSKLMRLSRKQGK